jgi:hypothetical protein
MASTLPKRFSPFTQPMDEPMNLSVKRDFAPEAPPSPSSHASQRGNASPRSSPPRGTPPRASPPDDFNAQFYINNINNNNNDKDSLHPMSPPIPPQGNSVGFVIPALVPHMYFIMIIVHQ